MTDKTERSPISDSPLRSVYSASFPQILDQLGVSLAISTYQSGQVILIRAENSGGLNTHFLPFARPMGMAVTASRLCIGTKRSIYDFWNVPAAAGRLPDEQRPDAVYALRNVHITGAIDIHEMAFAGNELWYINTAFSCLCVLEPAHGFDPRWRPRFVSGYSPQDRCHLNGLYCDSRGPRFVTALGECDDALGWRRNKHNGGILIDVASSEVMLGGLCMPHSPRWHDGRLWLLESGRGAVCAVDPLRGDSDTLCRLPGFTRGCDFAGPVMFVGLSQVRETNCFVDIPIVDENPERQSGVWAINWQTGQTLGFIRFEDRVQELFSVCVVPNTRWPELLDDNAELLDTLYILPDAALRDVRFVNESTT
ncbi:MAG: TIGR03032 family protein [Gammaproteobacteria bacterium]